MDRFPLDLLHRGMAMSRLDCLWRFATAFLLSLSIGILALASPAAAAGYKILKLVNGINRPDLPCCTPFYIYYYPVISGGKVVFLSRNGPPDGVWSGDIATGTLTKLVGLETKVPGGVGKFTIFYGSTETPLSIGGGIVTFFGADEADTVGIYTVPVAGGAIRRVATTLTIAPDGQHFTELRRAATNGKQVTFQALTSLHNSWGVYRAAIGGQGLTTVINSDTTLDARDTSGPVPDYYSTYAAPVYGLSSILFVATGLFDPVSGPNAVFRGNAATAVDMADNLTKLQGLVASHVRIDFLSAAEGSNDFGFIADEPALGRAGVFKGRSANYALKYATTLDTAPGTTRKYSTFLAMSYDDSGVVFSATRPVGSSTDQSIYFCPAPGQPVVRVASGAVYYLPSIGNRSLSNGKIVFMDGSNFADTVYVAVPIP